MAKKKPKKRQRKPFEILIEEKAKNFIRAIKEYWRTQDKLIQEYKETSVGLGGTINFDDIFPTELSNQILLFTDGIIFIRQKLAELKPPKTFIFNFNLDDWLKDGLKIPQNDLILGLPSILMGPGASLILNNCSFNELHIDYLHFSSFLYDNMELAPGAIKAIIDFRISILGMILQSGSAFFTPKVEQIIQTDNVLEQLQKKIEELKKLLETEVNEEKLQIFLKQNPFLLKPSSELIPKQKLGEDFVTDFVLLNILDQGPCYTFVELEKSSYPILTKGGVLTTYSSHAIKQTRDWDIWLEKNKAYLQNKLSGFESPEFLIVIGRTEGMDDSDKAYIRSYNREYKKLRIMSYDDVIAQTEEFIQSAKKYEQINNTSPL
jgi:Domain of unknown function (DUF4263)